MIWDVETTKLFILCVTMIVGMTIVSEVKKLKND